MQCRAVNGGCGHDHTTLIAIRPGDSESDSTGEANVMGLHTLHRGLSLAGYELGSLETATQC